MFNSYNRDAFTVGVQGGDKGVIVDLGTGKELSSRYGYEDTVGFGQGFASIIVREGRAYILKDRLTHSLQPLDESEILFAEPKRNLHTTPVKVGHIYILRITGTHEPTELIAKLVVLSHIPNESVTLRWLTIGKADPID